MPLAGTFGAVTARAYGLFAQALQAVDQYFNYVTLLLPGNGTNGAQNNTFLDSSVNNFTITRNGNTTQGTFSPFSQTGWSNYFNGSTDWLTGTLALGNGNFTEEAWVYKIVTTKGTVFDTRNANPSASGISVEINTSNFIELWAGSGVTPILTSTIPITLNAWTHIAIVRNSGVITIYVNGTAGGTLSTAQNFSDSSLVIGSNNPRTGNFNGYISNIRISNSTAFYTANFTPSITPLTAISGTSLLTCQSNRFVDNSASPLTLTVNGNTSIQAFSPFNPTAAWSAATYGGSGYFDGSGDYLTAPSNAAFNISTGNYTFECWVYKQTSSRVMLVAVASAGLAIAINASGNIEVCRSLTAIDFTFTAGVTNNQWTHIAVSRSATDLRAFMNGVLLGTQTSSTSYGQGICYIGIDADGASTPYFGYITDARLVKGTAVYTSTFTPPTAPLTAITNTSLLLNFTNGAIYDAAAKNDLETVGNAQISTTQSKWGGSSMYFDGSGDKIVAPFSQWLQMGSSDWTIEMWLYLNAAPGGGLYYDLYVNRASTADYSPIAIFVNSARQIEAYFSTSGSGWTSSLTTSGTISTSTWTHVAVVRNGSTVKVYFNGTADATTTTISGALFTNTAQLWVGGENGGNDLNGYIDDFRITKGVARYTSNFTSPTAPFPVR